MNYYFKILLALVISLGTISASAQLTATISQNITICAGETASMTFAATGGTPPYVFAYTVNGGAINTISSVTGNPVVLNEVFAQAGTFNYTLVSVEDANTTETLNLNSSVTVHATPVINAGPDQTICAGSTVILAISGTFGCIYTWSGGVSPNGTIAPTATSTYYVTGTCGGCSAVDNVTVNVIPYDHPTATATIDSATCHDGSVALTISGNNPPYAIAWYDMGTGAMISPLAPGNYTATITDASGCSMDTSFTVPASLLPFDCGTISGSVHYDDGQNCITDAGDAPIGNRMIIANPGNFIAFTDATGYYELHLYPGSYTIQESFNNTDFGSMCNASQQVNLAGGQTMGGFDFLDTINGGADYQAYNSLNSTPLFMGSLSFTHVITDLTGYQGLENLTGWFTIPPQLILMPWNVPHTISNDTVYFSVDTSAFNWVNHVNFDLTAVDLGDTISFCSGVTSSVPEGNLINNTYCQNGIVVGPYDPNDITMILNGVPSDSTILVTDMALDYRIRFQNTGTAEAINVYVLDTISEYLDLSSFQLISTSHNCQMSVMDGRVLKFNFPLIHLPDSNTNQAGSNGFIHYKIRQRPANPIGTVILNTAYIYFDFNEPVITNTSYDMIVSNLGMIENVSAAKFKIYPNPAKEEVFIDFGPSVGSPGTELEFAL